MAYTTTELITDAYYASGITSRRFETVSGSEVKEGLIWLNDILNTKIVEPDLIPYETTYTGTFVVGQEAYPIENLITPDTLTYTNESVRYSMKWTPRDSYFGSNRVNDIDSMPYCWYSERTLTGSTVYVYFLPNQAYTFEIHGIFRLSEVTLSQDLSLTLNKFYTTYLKYSLAAMICAEYGESMPASVMNELDKYRALISKQSRVLDMSIKKTSTLQVRQQLGWAWVNLGDGYVIDGG